ncbi:zinc finger protein 155 [Musca vetustissima]|uniref:zinc finger protein 155 n=1 Tax=Musca vetustissima TaxID=27455 RepID=UPI002AB6699B|nr:zinc finger protein 155 [Musca vetustissima]
MLNELTANCCRICLGKAKKLRSLYKPVDEGDEPPNEMLLKVTGIAVEEEDKHTMLPKTICKNCEMSLSMAFEFREKALQSHELLMSYVGELKGPEEAELVAEFAGETHREDLVIKTEEAAAIENGGPQNCYEENLTREQNIEGNQTENNQGIMTEENVISNRDETPMEQLVYNNEDPNQEEEFDSHNEHQDDDDHHLYEQMETISNTSEHEIEELQRNIENEEQLHQQLAANVRKKRSISLAEETVIELVDDDGQNVAKQKHTKKGKENEMCQDDRENIDSIEIAVKDECDSDVKPLEQRRRRKPREEAQHAFICDICGNVFSKRGRMMEHRQRHDKNPKYACELCDKKFHMRELLRKHMFSHSGGKPYKCEYCSRTFYYESVKKAHEAVHQGLKPYICDVCGKAFSYGHSLKKHKLIHAEVKLYRCEYCNKDFRLQHHMKQHEQTKAHRREVQLAGGTVEDLQDTMVTEEEDEEHVFTIMVEEQEVN